MSEYQYVAFLAVDRAVSEKNLAYMRRQSSHADRKYKRSRCDTASTC
jgi:hypothetical protein